jgi:tetratricopeptide (TPR) repeat protein
MGDSHAVRLRHDNCRRCAGIVLFFLALLTAHEAHAQQQGADKVTFRSETGGRVVVRGTILEYTGRTLKLKPISGAEAKQYPVDQVIEVRTPQSESHTRGLQLFSQKRYADAETAFESALDIESDDSDRKWVRRELLSLLVRCALQQGKASKARSRFGLLVDSDSTTRHFRLIPLVWVAAAADARTTAEGRLLLEEQQPTRRLMGASLLLQHATYGKVAVADMQKLVVNGDPRISSLAVAQLWRVRLAEADPRRDEIVRWRKAIDRMPGELRGGPYYLLGQAHLRRAENDRAAMALAWLPLVDDHDSELAARAGVEAAEALAQIGQRNEAVTFYRDVLLRFPQASFAQDAKAGLKTLIKPPAKPATEGTNR